MELTRELLLPYQGLDAFNGLCHLRVYEQPGQLPVVIAGGLDDNPGTPLTHAVEMVAAAVQHTQFSDGREFRLIEHYRDGIDGRPAPAYSLVHFSHRPLEESPEIEGEFRHPCWEPIDDVEQLVRCKVAIWTPGTYTARAVAGEQGERLRRELAENGDRGHHAILVPQADRNEIDPAPGLVPGPFRNRALLRLQDLLLAGRAAGTRRA
jgi:hypothetical protein